jgi:lipopolysaccharide/colanic/teichoic acid biosynthesis glycosyltransferase
MILDVLTTLDRPSSDVAAHVSPGSASTPLPWVRRALVPAVAALPVALVADVRVAVLALLGFVAAAVLDGRRPAAIATLPLGRHAVTAAHVGAAAVLVALVTIAGFGASALPVLALAGGALVALAGLRAADALDDHISNTRVLVLGTEGEARDLRRTVEEVGAHRFRVVATTDDLTDLDALADAADADLVVFTDHVSRPAVLGHVAATMRTRPIRAMHQDAFCEVALGVVPLASVDAAWLAGLADPAVHASEPRASRVLDVVVSLLLLVPVAPLLLLIAPWIAADREGGVFFRQERVGRGGRAFSILKLRTMRGTGSDWSAPGDPRVTRLGAILRKTHIDELPQLINVLRGDMSLVGPRPEQVRISAELETEIPLFPYRHMVRPGITGWARVRCGYARTAEESALKLGNDLFYIKHRSFVLDLAILLETLRLTLFEKQFEVRAPAAKYVLGPRRPANDDAFPLAAPVPGDRAAGRSPSTVAVS